MKGDQLLFQNKTILITGASSDIGLSLIEHLSAEGAKLILHTSNKQSEEKLRHLLSNIPDIVYFNCDFSKPHIMEDVYLSSGLENIALDGFVNCVGVRSRRPINLIKPEHSIEVMQTNFVSFIEMIRIITKKNRFNSPLNIVTISSISSVTGGQGITIYSASKAAVDAAVRCLSKELAPKGIRINSVVCGQVNSKAYHEMMDSKTDQYDPILERQFLGLIEPEKVSSMVMFLLSEQSAYITGSMIPVDGGYLS